MTNEEAIEILQHEHDYAQLLTYVNDAIKIATQALYKQIPKTPNIVGDGLDDSGNINHDTWICPTCESEYEVGYDSYSFCPNCGQAIDNTALDGC